ncbi:transmembrane protein, putative [Medicago truncatula]|uniref:Transmembrane protein, putative n=1 Tax=Medicago truncatula TaxID=3880 RepID=A0A072TR51_MEDTR|nr:transmembrane protein, putative [Medicago truncatula]
MGSITRWGASVLWVVQNSKKRKLGSEARVGPHRLGKLGLNRFGSSLVRFRRTEPAWANLVLIPAALWLCDLKFSVSLSSSPCVSLLSRSCVVRFCFWCLFPVFCCVFLYSSAVFCRVLLCSAPFLFLWVAGIYRARLMLGFVGAEPKISNLGRRKRERVSVPEFLQRIGMNEIWIGMAYA